MSNVTGWKTAGTCADDSSAGSIQWWNDYATSTALTGTELSADDNTNAECLLTSTAVSRYLKATNFGFTSSDIPGGSVIDGFEIEVRRYRSGTSYTVASTLIKFVKGGTISGNDLGASGDWPTSETAVTYGSSTELGGLSWTQSDVVASNFGMVLQATANSGRIGVPADGTHFVDQVCIRVYWTAGTPAGDAVMTMTATCDATVTQGPGQYQKTYRLDNWTSVARSGNTFTWTNEGNAENSDDARAQTLGMQGNNGSGGYTTYLKGFTLAGADPIPAGTTIDGIRVNIERRTDPSFMTGVRDSVVSLVRDGTIEATNKAATGTNWPVTTDGTAQYGGSSDLWSASWTPDDINDPDFGVVLSVANNTTTGVPVAGRGEVDQITVDVWYTVPSGGTNWTSGATANLALTAQSGSQQNLKGEGFGSVTLTASANGNVGGGGQANLAMTTACDAKVTRFGSASGAMAMTGSATGKLTYNANANAGMAMTSSAAGFRTAMTGAAAAMAITAQAVVPIYGAGSASMAITAQANGTPVKLGAGTAGMAVTAFANGVRFQSGSASASLALTTAVDGNVVKLGAGIASMTLTGLLNPGGYVSGGTANMTIAGSATGKLIYSSPGSASMAMVGNADGRATRFGSASGAMAMTGSATVGGLVSGGSASMAMTAQATGKMNLPGAGSAAMAITGSANPQSSYGASGSASMAMTAQAIGLLTPGGVANLAMFAQAGGLVTRFGAGSAGMALTAQVNAGSTKFGAGDANLVMLATADGFRLAKVPGTASLALTAQANGVKWFQTPGTANMTLSALAGGKVTRQAPASASMAMTAQANGTVGYRSGGTASMAMTTTGNGKVIRQSMAIAAMAMVAQSGSRMAIVAGGNASLVLLAGANGQEAEGNATASLSMTAQASGRVTRKGAGNAHLVLTALVDSRTTYFSPETRRFTIESDAKVRFTL